MNIRHFILATAGHVDHGKSALVKALTGIDPDRLPEEKARGITIDLGFAHFELPAPAVAIQPAIFHVGIIDVPGHEDFVKNMVAGVGSIDVALLVVAADDGWMPQTEEHLQILSYLGVTRAVVALTKIDLAMNEADSVAAIREKLIGSPFADAPVVATSIVSGRGFDELKDALARVLADTPPASDIGKPRLPIDRVFVLRGIGTVVTGTLLGGELRRGQEVVMMPGGGTARIRSLQTHGREVEASGPGTRTALSLPDVVASGLGAEQAVVRRGQAVTLPELARATDTLDVFVEKSARLDGGPRGAARPLKDGTLVRVHHGSGNFSARVVLRDAKELVAGGRAFAQLRPEQPVFVFAGDRFIVRDWSEQATLAGGLVLEVGAARKSPWTEASRQCLQARADFPRVARVWVDSLLRKDQAVRRAEILVPSRFSLSEIAGAVVDLLREGELVEAGDWVARRSWWLAVQAKAAQIIDAEHRTHPERVGCALSELRAALQPDLPEGALLDLLVADLCQREFVQQATAIRRASHRPALPPQLQAAGARLRAALSAKPLEPPGRNELAPDAVAQQALRFLLQTGEAVELSADCILLAEVFRQSVDAIRGHLRSRGAATVSELRPVVGTSRRILIPLLERLDRDGITVRQDDVRRLK